MANSIDKTATSVIERFKRELKPNALQCLSAADFELLAILIKSAIAAERKDTAAKLETLALDLTADIEHIDLSL